MGLGDGPNGSAYGLAGSRWAWRASRFGVADSALGDDTYEPLVASVIAQGTEVAAKDRRRHRRHLGL